MASDLKFMLFVIAGIVGISIVLMGLIALSDYLYEKHVQCPAFAQNVERPYKYDWFAGGCFVQTSTGQWVAEKNYWNNPVLSK